MKSKNKTARAVKTKTVKANRSAKTGKFVSEDFASKNPDTTFKDSLKRRKNANAGRS